MRTPWFFWPSGILAAACATAINVWLWHTFVGETDNAWLVLVAALTGWAGAVGGFVIGIKLALYVEFRGERLALRERDEATARHLLQSLEDLSLTCHCGRPAEPNKILGYSRGMCADCDAWRCDAYPAGCHHLHPIEQAHVNKRRKEKL